MDKNTWIEGSAARPTLTHKLVGNEETLHSATSGFVTDDPQEGLKEENTADYYGYDTGELPHGQDGAEAGLGGTFSLAFGLVATPSSCSQASQGCCC